MKKHNVDIDVQTIKKDSKIYKDLKPGSFLFEYRSNLNDAALKVALDNPTITSNKVTHLERAKRKVEADGYVYKKKKSHSSTLNAPEPEKPVKMKPSIKAKKLEEMSKDLKKLKRKYFTERSREKARNLNADEQSLRLTKEMDPLQVKKCHLEELPLLQNK